MLSVASRALKRIASTENYTLTDVFVQNDGLGGTVNAGKPILKGSRGGVMDTDGEVISDSEDNRKQNGRSQQNDTIVISSDSEGEKREIIKRPKNAQVRLPGGWPSDSEKGTENETPSSNKLLGTRRRFFRRRIIESSDSDSDSDSEGSEQAKPAAGPLDGIQPQRDVIELTSSSESEAERSPSYQARTNHKRVQKTGLPTYISQKDNGAVLEFNEPKSARKPLRLSAPKQHSPSKQPWHVGSIEQPTTDHSPSLDSPVQNTPISGAPLRPKSTRSAPRLSKKAIEAAEQARREKYAQELFTELNRTVFKDRLPVETKLNWSKRLLTTAGKARYHRSRDGVETSQIELATKVLDCEERIRNTLSHEMCHLATWVIDKKLDENHGKLFKYWARKVVKKRPDIEITTKHHYEISYPFKWECEKCQKVYGRHSKSIQPDRCVCGACGEGRLIPLFPVRGKGQTPKTSRLAAEKPQESPRSLPRPPQVHVEFSDTEDALYLSDIDADIDALTLTISNTHLA